VPTLGKDGTTKEARHGKAALRFVLIVWADDSFRQVPFRSVPSRPVPPEGRLCAELASCTQTHKRTDGQVDGNEPVGTAIGHEET
jgi:hypothetical protein